MDIADVRREMLVQHVLQSIVTQRSSARGWKDRLVRLAMTFTQPTAQHENSVFAQRRATTLSAFALASYVGTGAEHDILTAKAGELCGAQPGLDSQYQKGPITAP